MPLLPKHKIKHLALCAVLCLFIKANCLGNTKTNFYFNILPLNEKDSVLTIRIKKNFEPEQEDFEIKRWNNKNIFIKGHIYTSMGKMSFTLIDSTKQYTIKGQFTYGEDDRTEWMGYDENGDEVITPPTPRADSTWTYTSFTSKVLAVRNYSMGFKLPGLQQQKKTQRFYNWLIKHEKRHDEEPRFKRKRVSIYILQWDSASFANAISRYNILIENLDKSRDTVFTRAEKEHLLAQIKTVTDSVFTIKFKHTKIATTIIQKQHYYSLPIYTSNNKYIIVRQQFYCGSLCAYGGYYVYIKYNKRWRLMGRFGTWVS